jgi:hypothetical protein
MDGWMDGWMEINGRKRQGKMVSKIRRIKKIDEGKEETG